MLNRESHVVIEADAVPVVDELDGHTAAGTGIAQFDDRGLPEIEKLLRNEELSDRNRLHQTGNSVEMVNVGMRHDDGIDSRMPTILQRRLNRALGDPFILHRAGVIEERPAGGHFEKYGSSMADR